MSASQEWRLGEHTLLIVLQQKRPIRSINGWNGRFRLDGVIHLRGLDDCHFVVDWDKICAVKTPKKMSKEILRVRGSSSAQSGLAYFWPHVTLNVRLGIFYFSRFLTAFFTMFLPVCLLVYVFKTSGLGWCFQSIPQTKCTSRNYIGQ